MSPRIHHRTATVARAYLNDLPDAKLVWLDSGHFVLDENATQVAAEIKAAFAPEISAA